MFIYIPFTFIIILLKGLCKFYFYKIFLVSFVIISCNNHLVHHICSQLVSLYQPIRTLIPINGRSISTFPSTAVLKIIIILGTYSVWQLLGIAYASHVDDVQLCAIKNFVFFITKHDTSFVSVVRLDHRPSGNYVVCWLLLCNCVRFIWDNPSCVAFNFSTFRLVTGHTHMVKEFFSTFFSIIQYKVIRGLIND